MVEESLHWVEEACERRTIAMCLCSIECKKLQKVSLEERISTYLSVLCSFTIVKKNPPDRKIHESCAQYWRADSSVTIAQMLGQDEGNIDIVRDADQLAALLEYASHACSTLSGEDACDHCRADEGVDVDAEPMDLDEFSEAAMDKCRQIGLPREHKKGNACTKCIVLRRLCNLGSVPGKFSGA
jgi:hypothetical protein